VSLTPGQVVVVASLLTELRDPEFSVLLVSSESCPFDSFEEHCGGIFQWPMNTPSCMDNSLR
jgi:hypothetical protein